jgi:phosphatidyl-myo-inositol dimannoside synthase
VLKKRILIFTHEYPPFPGGIARYAGELAQAAAALGHEVHVVAPGYGRERHAEDVSPGGVVVHRTPAGEYRGKRLPAMIWEILHHLGKGKWDFVHAIDRPYATVLAFIARFKRLAFQTTVHGTDVMTLHRSKSAKLLCNGNPYAGSDRVLCNSHFTRDLLHAEIPSLPRNKSFVTHLGVNAFWFEEPRKDSLQDLRRRLVVQAGQKVILTVARLERRKGHLAVLESLQNCWDAGIRDFHYVIVGGAGEQLYEAELKDQIGKAPFPVTLAGILDETDLRTLYCIATIFCMPGVPVPERIEGFGLAYLEAAACSLPCIGTKMGGVGEVIRDQETGYLLPSPEPSLLSAAIRSLLTDDSRRSSMAETSRLWAQKFTWARCAMLSYGGAETLPPDSLVSCPKSTYEKIEAVWPEPN